MKTKTKFQMFTAIICLAFLHSIVAFGLAPSDKNSTQTLLYKTGNPADWPKHQDAVISAKKNHKILLENDSIRVLEVIVLPGETEAVHHHQGPSVLYVMEAEDFIDHDGDGKVIFDTCKLAAALQLPLTIWKGSEAPHAV
jgi:mannose-6-phosphate isomerase-like protein (cupin superfamily)